MTAHPRFMLCFLTALCACAQADDGADEVEYTDPGYHTDYPADTMQISDSIPRGASPTIATPPPRDPRPRPAARDTNAR